MTALLICIVITGLVTGLLYLIFDMFFTRKAEVLRGDNNEVTKTIPVPPFYPIVGHVPYLSPASLLLSLASFNNKFGDLFDVFTFTSRQRIVCCPSIMKEVLKKRPKVVKRSTPQTEDGPFQVTKMDLSLFNTEGKSWSRMRRLISPHFSKLNVRLMTDTICDEALHLIDVLKSCGSSGKDTIVDFDKMAQVFAVRSIGRVAIGLSGEDMEEYFGTNDIVDDTNAIFKLIEVKILYPYASWTFKYSESYKHQLAAGAASCRMQHHIQLHIDRYKQRKILETEGRNQKSGEDGDRRRGRDDDGCAPKHSSLIDSMIREGEQAQHDVSSGEITQNIINLFVAGSETTSAVITWTVYVLQVSGGDPSGPIPSILTCNDGHVLLCRDHAFQVLHRDTWLPRVQQEVMEVLNERKGGSSSDPEV